jgi:broad specificity phosphatase PhoE
MERVIIFFRHGQTDWNLNKRFQGQSNVPLNESGRFQAQNLANYLKSKSIEVIYTSDLDRAVETAQIINQHHKVPVIKDQRLREANLGELEGLILHEAEAKFGKHSIDRWKSNSDDALDFCFPNGETKLQVLTRVKAFLELMFLKNENYKQIAISTHGAVIHKLVFHLMGEKYTEYPVTNCSLFIFKEKNGIYQFLEYKDFS